MPDRIERCAETVLKINSVYWRYCFEFNERQLDLHNSSKVSSKVMPYHLTHFVFLCKWVWKESEYWINQSGLALLFLWRCNLPTPLPWGCTVIDENDKQIPAFKALWGIPNPKIEDKFSGTDKSPSALSTKAGLQVIYQTQKTLFHRNIQTPKKRVKNTTRSGVFLTRFEVFG